MNCQEAKELLALYTDSDSLTQHQKKEIDEHIETCPACLSELADIKVTVQILRAQEKPAIPEKLHEHIMAAISREKNAQQIPKRKFWQKSYRPLFSAAAIFLVILLSGNIYLAAHFFASANMADEMFMAEEAFILESQPFSPEVLEKVAEERDAGDWRAEKEIETEAEATRMAAGEDYPAAVFRPNYRLLIFFNLIVIIAGILVFSFLGRRSNLFSKRNR